MSDFAIAGAERLLADLGKRQAAIAARVDPAERAMATELLHAARAAAPRSKGSRSRRGAAGPHFAQTIRIRHSARGYAVGPASRLASIVIRGTKVRSEVVGGGGAKHQATLLGRSQMRAHARHVTGPVMGARALAWQSGGGVIFRHSAHPGPSPRHPFLAAAAEASHAARMRVAREVLFGR